MHAILTDITKSHNHMKNKPSQNDYNHASPSKIRAWFLAARPKTLTGAAAPVLVGMAMAWHVRFAPVWEQSSLLLRHPLSDAYTRSQLLLFLIPATLCLLFALVMQIDANFINDYFDCKKGTDGDDRLGPPRACAQGWLQPREMVAGIILTTLLASAIGVLILLWALQYELIAVGLLCILFSFLYTTHLSYRGLGDLLVLLFFGIVPVGFTYYVISIGEWAPLLTVAGLGMGLATDTLLMVNNYRDRNQDAMSGKKTVVVYVANRFGKRDGARIARGIYMWLGIAAAVLAVAVVVLLKGHFAYLMLLYLLLHMHTYTRMCKCEGRELNSVLGATARNIFLYGLLLSFCIVSSLSV